MAEYRAAYNAAHQIEDVTERRRAPAMAIGDFLRRRIARDFLDRFLTRIGGESDPKPIAAKLGTAAILVVRCWRIASFRCATLTPRSRTRRTASILNSRLSLRLCIARLRLPETPYLGVTERQQARLGHSTAELRPSVHTKRSRRFLRADIAKANGHQKVTTVPLETGSSSSSWKFIRPDGA